MRLRGLVALVLAFAIDADGQTMSQAKQDCEALLNAVLPFAEQMLKDHGEFFPFGGAVRANGQIISVAGFDGRERPPSTEIIKLLKDGFVESARRREYKATALVYDVRNTVPGNSEKSDAIAVALDHRDSYSIM